MSDPVFEQRFWLQIAGDHARFIETALAPAETADVRRAGAFIRSFDALLAEARKPDAANGMAVLNEAALREAEALRAFKLDLLGRLLTGRVQLLLTPSFLSHMINEIEEYLRIAASIRDGKGVPVCHPLHYDLLWLQDAYGHAASIAGDLDFAESELIGKSMRHQKTFQAYYLKAVELTGYLRTGMTELPAMGRFHRDVDMAMRVFMHFLAELEEMELGAEVLDRMSPLMPDHMFREECYYLTKLAEAGAVPPPGCDPAKPRAGA